jgi:hypothetical protein
MTITPAQIEAGARALCKRLSFRFEPRDADTQAGREFIDHNWRHHAVDARACVLAAEAAAWVKPSAEWPKDGERVLDGGSVALARMRGGGWVGVNSLAYAPPHLCRPIPEAPTEGE